MKSLIIGCGDIGTQLGKLLIGDGQTVLAARRNIERLPESFIPIEMDIYQPIAFTIPKDIDVIYFTAAANDRTAADYRAIYHDGLCHLINAVKQQNISPRKVIFISSTSVYHQNDGQQVDESAPALPTSDTGKQILAAEHALADSGLPFNIVRSSGIYGPGRFRMIRIAEKSRPQQGDEKQATNRIHSKDLARFLRHLGNHQSLPNETYIATDSMPASKAAVIHGIRQILGLEARNYVQESEITENKICLNDKMLSTGFELIYPNFKKGYESLV